MGETEAPFGHASSLIVGNARHETHATSAIRWHTAPLLAGEGVGGGVSPTHLDDACEDGGQVVKHLVIGDTQDSQPMRGKHRITLLVILRLLRVNTSVYFNDEPGRVAIEIYDEASNNLLTAKDESSTAQVPERIPELALRWRHLLAQFTRPLHFDG